MAKYFGQDLRARGESLAGEVVDVWRRLLARLFSGWHDGFVVQTCQLKTAKAPERPELLRLDIPSHYRANMAHTRQSRPWLSGKMP